MGVAVCVCVWGGGRLTGRPHSFGTTLLIASTAGFACYAWAALIYGELITCMSVFIQYTLMMPTFGTRLVLRVPYDLHARCRIGSLLRILHLSQAHFLFCLFT